MLETGYRFVIGVRIRLPGCDCFYTLVNGLWLVVDTGYRIVASIRKWLHGLAGIRSWLRVVTGIRNWLPGCDYCYTLIVGLRLVYTGYRILWLALESGYLVCWY